MIKNKDISIIKELSTKYGLDINKLISRIKSYLSDFDEKKFLEAFIFSANAHKGQYRKQAGIPYIAHPFETAKILTTIHADQVTLTAALLHDVPEDTGVPLEEIAKKFGEKVAYLIEGITKLSKVHYSNDMRRRNVESLKKLFIHVASDPRTMLIKLADRLHNMRTLEYMDAPEKRKRIATETLEIFVPVANLLGIKEIQAEMEDLCFKYIYNEDFNNLKLKYHESREENSDNREKTVRIVEQQMKNIGIEAIVYGQEPNLFEIYKDLKNERKTIEEYEARFQIHILVHSIPDCYNALGTVHNRFKPIANTFQDYIALPMTNGYQSLHTSVFGLNGIITRFIIRTNQMHYDAQYGIAARYFIEGMNHEIKLELSDPRSQWVEEVMEIQKEDDRDAFLDEIKSEVFQDRINVFTPKGRAISLPIGSTCIDFAYHIHTEVGHRSIRALINQNNVSLNHVLNDGDVVKIITTDYAKSPSYEWLNFAKTSFAKKRMKEFFKKESRASKIVVGKKMLQKEFDRAGYGLVNNISKWRLQKFKKVRPIFQLDSFEDLLVLIAEGIISPMDYINSVYRDSEVKTKQKSQSENLIRKKRNSLRYPLKIICDSFVNITKLIELLENKKPNIVLQCTDIRHDTRKMKIVIRTTLISESYNALSRVCSELEQIDGVKEIRRINKLKKLIFIIGALITFFVWALHPVILYFLTYTSVITQEDQNDYRSIFMYSGLLVLFALIFAMRRYTESTFPGLRESNRLWAATFVLILFALGTIIAEIYIYTMQVDWLAAFFLMLAFISYVLSEYILYKSR